MKTRAELQAEVDDLTRQVLDYARVIQDLRYRLSIAERSGSAGRTPDMFALSTSAYVKEPYHE